MKLQYKEPEIQWYECHHKSLSEAELYHGKDNVRLATSERGAQPR